MSSKFIKVRKANKSHDRGFIAIDAICSVFEDKEQHIVSIMTMDGFWYDVDDDVDALYALIVGEDKKECGNREFKATNKKEYFRRKKMMQPSAAQEKVVAGHEDMRTNRLEAQKSKEIEDEDVFRPVFRRGKDLSLDKAKNRKGENLSAGADEGHYELNPKVERPPIGEGL